MQIESIDISAIKPYAKNAKKHPKEQVEKIMRSIERFGWAQPLVVDKENVLIIGHGRLEAAKKLKMDTVPVLRMENLSNDEVNALRLADNKLNESEWDMELVNLELGEMSDELKELTGFEPMEVLEAQEDDFDTTPPEEPKSKLGDLYQLGEHRLLCGSSTVITDVERLMNGEKADMVLTDPPYLMGFEGNVHGDGTKSHNAKHGTILNDKMTEEDGNAFVSDFIGTIKMFCSGAFYISFYRLGLEYIFRGLEANGLQYRSVIIWDKGNHTLSNSDYMSRYEPIVYGWVDRHEFYGKPAFDIWEISRTQKNDLHPTMKPVALMAKAIENSSKVGDMVMDIFGGSGSTLIACEQTGRKCRMMELDPKYCDVIVNRWEKLTGKKAELL